MSLNGLDLMRWNRISASLGGIIWVLVLCVWVPGWLALNALEVLLLLALLVITPLAVPLAASSKKGRLHHSLYRLMVILQPFAALMGGASFLLSAGPFAAAAAGVWLLFTALVGLVGLLRLFRTGGVALADVCLSAALIYLPIGGAWLVLARLDAQPLGFGQHTDLLTAVHFHYIPLAALLITGLTCQALPATLGSVWRVISRIAAIGMLVNPLLVAAGITLTKLTGVDFLESAAAALLALSLIAIGVLSLRFIIPNTASLFARGLILIASTAVFVTMLAAGAYALGNATGAWAITVDQMIAVHGWINALIFGCCGLLGWRLTRG
ncbi:MAG TPA: YndJ family transporter [Ktedonobacterales bacterium]|nr:YndJ family transporter [Ktedonobacterales bacterium]